MKSRLWFSPEALAVAVSAGAVSGKTITSNSIHKTERLGELGSVCPALAGVTAEATDNEGDDTSADEPGS